MVSGAIYMSGKRVTRKDVADRAGVTPTIVSYVTNNNRYVSKDKRERVLQAIKELGYHPNTVALGLKCKKSYHIAFICDDISNEHFAKIVMDMEDIANERGYIISFCNTRRDEQYINKLISRQFDGAIISTDILEGELINKFPDIGIPTILFGNRIHENISKDITFVNIDIYGGTLKAMEHLVKEGHTKIAFVDSSLKEQDTIDYNDLRVKGYAEIHEKYNMVLNKDYIIQGANGYKDVFEKSYQLFQSKDRPTAILVNDDMHAYIVMSAVKSLNLEVPEDVSIIGYNDTTIAKYMVPRLTTVEIPRKKISRAALELLIDKIEGKVVKDIDIDTDLIIGNTTKSMTQ